MRDVNSITAGIEAPNTDISYMPPTRILEYRPDAAAITFLDFNVYAPGDYTAPLVFTVTMRNGDVIRVRQLQRSHTIKTYNFTPKDTPMETAAGLQALYGAGSGVSASSSVHLTACRFSGNEMDINNRFGQTLELDGAIFE